MLIEKLVKVVLFTLHNTKVQIFYCVILERERERGIEWSIYKAVKDIRAILIEWNYFTTLIAFLFYFKVILFIFIVFVITRCRIHVLYFTMYSFRLNSREIMRVVILNFLRAILLYVYRYINSNSRPIAVYYLLLLNDVWCLNNKIIGLWHLIKTKTR